MENKKKKICFTMEQYYHCYRRQRYYKIYMKTNYDHINTLNPLFLSFLLYFILLIFCILNDVSLSLSYRNDVVRYNDASICYNSIISTFYVLSFSYNRQQSICQSCKSSSISNIIPTRTTLSQQHHHRINDKSRTTTQRHSLLLFKPIKSSSSSYSFALSSSSQPRPSYVSSNNDDPYSKFSSNNFNNNDNNNNDSGIIILRIEKLENFMDRATLLQVRCRDIGAINILDSLSLMIELIVKQLEQLDQFPLSDPIPSDMIINGDNSDTTMMKSPINRWDQFFIDIETKLLNYEKILFQNTYDFNNNNGGISLEEPSVPPSSPPSISPPFQSSTSSSSSSSTSFTWSKTNQQENNDIPVPKGSSSNNNRRVNIKRKIMQDNNSSNNRYKNNMSNSLIRIRKPSFRYTDVTFTGKNNDYNVPMKQITSHAFYKNQYKIYMTMKKEQPNPIFSMMNNLKNNNNNNNIRQQQEKYTSFSNPFKQSSPSSTTTTNPTFKSSSSATKTEIPMFQTTDTFSQQKTNNDVESSSSSWGKQQAKNSPSWNNNDNEKTSKESSKTNQNKEKENSWIGKIITPIIASVTIFSSAFFFFNSMDNNVDFTKIPTEWNKQIESSTSSLLDNNFQIPTNIKLPDIPTNIKLPDIPKFQLPDENSMNDMISQLSNQFSSDNTKSLSVPSIPLINNIPIKIPFLENNKNNIDTKIKTTETTTIPTKVTTESTTIPSVVSTINPINVAPEQKVDSLKLKTIAPLSSNEKVSEKQVVIDDKVKDNIVQDNNILKGEVEKKVEVTTTGKTIIFNDIVPKKDAIDKPSTEKMNEVVVVKDVIDTVKVESPSKGKEEQKVSTYGDTDNLKATAAESKPVTTPDKVVVDKVTSQSDATDKSESTKEKNVILPKSSDSVSASVKDEPISSTTLTTPDVKPSSDANKDMEKVTNSKEENVPSSVLAPTVSENANEKKPVKAATEIVVSPIEGVTTETKEDKKSPAATDAATTTTEKSDTKDVTTSSSSSSSVETSTTPSTTIVDEKPAVDKLESVKKEDPSVSLDRKEKKVTTDTTKTALVNEKSDTNAVESKPAVGTSESTNKFETVTKESTQTTSPSTKDVVPKNEMIEKSDPKETRSSSPTTAESVPLKSNISPNSITEDQKPPLSEGAVNEIKKDNPTTSKETTKESPIIKEVIESENNDAPKEKEDAIKKSSSPSKDEVLIDTSMEKAKPDLSENVKTEFFVSQSDKASSITDEKVEIKETVSKMNDASKEKIETSSSSSSSSLDEGRPVEVSAPKVAPAAVVEESKKIVNDKVDEKVSTASIDVVAAPLSPTKAAALSEDGNNNNNNNNNKPKDQDSSKE